MILIETAKLADRGEEFVSRVRDKSELKGEVLCLQEPDYEDLFLSRPRPASPVDAPRKLVLKSWLSLGDITVMTGAIRDLHAAHPGRFLTDVDTPSPGLWENNPYVTNLRDDEAEWIDLHYPLIHRSNQSPHHFINGYRMDLEQKLGLSIPAGEFRGDVHLSAEERAMPPLVEGPYWLIASGGKPDFTVKHWDPARHQSVVDHFRGRIQFVQIGERIHLHQPLSGVIDLLGQTTDVRKLLRLIYHADGVLCGITSFMHLAAAVPVPHGKRKLRPCVVVAGGREPSQWVSYPGHRFLHTIGSLSCCEAGGCWKARVVPLGDGAEQDNCLCEKPVKTGASRTLPRCMDLITPADVVRAIESYYPSGESIRVAEPERAISFSLYGPRTKYVLGMLENLKLAPLIYPGWRVIVHVERGHYAIPRLRRDGAEVVELDPAPASRGMFWRLLPIEDARFSHVIVRDADSRLNVRERPAVDAWIESRQPLHVMRDHPAHFHQAIIGGAWGAIGGAFPISTPIRNWPHTNQYGDDEKFLGQIVWPLFERGQFLRHSCFPRDGDSPFPAHPEYSGFVCEQISPEFTEFLGGIYVLNPDRYPRRLARFRASLEAHGGFVRRVGVKRWRASAIGERMIPAGYPYQDHPHYFHASRDHLEILESAAAAGVSNLIVFEDDVLFHPEFEEFFARMWIALPPDWTACMLGGQPHTDHAREHTSPPHPEALAIARGCMGMHATLWSAKGVREGRRFLGARDGTNIDNAFAEYQAVKPVYLPARWIAEIDPNARQWGLDE